MKIEYFSATLGDIRVLPSQTKRKKDSMPAAIEVRGQLAEASERFWRSLFSRFGLHGRIFRYFGYDEVLNRVIERNNDTNLRLCLEHPDKGRPRLLAASDPKRANLDYDLSMELMNRHGGSNISYHDGQLCSTHSPRSGDFDFSIGPDRFNNRFVADVPIDGLGQPRLYLSLVRQICTNGAIGYTRVFRSDIRVGQDVVHTVGRALEQFDHDEGFAALRQRFESAQKSWASLNEVSTLRKTLAKCGAGSYKYIETLNKITGDLNGIYGMANLDTLSTKRQRVLPAQCKVYDLLNLASEIATHRTGPAEGLRLQGFIGTAISEEYDLEGTAEKVPEFTDLFLNQN